MAALKKIESDLLKLPTKERARLAARLIESLDHESDEECERAWFEEAERRDKEMRDGKVKGIAADVIFKRIKSTLR